MSQNVADLPKLLRCVRQPDGGVKLFVGEQELMVTDYGERYSTFHGHTMSITVLAAQVHFEGESK